MALELKFYCLQCKIYTETEEWWNTKWRKGQKAAQTKCKGCGRLVSKPLSRREKDILRYEQEV